MKRRDVVDDDGDRVLSIEMSSTRTLRVVLQADDQREAMTSVGGLDAWLLLGDVDAADAREMAMFWADVAAALDENAG